MCYVSVGYICDREGEGVKMSEFENQKVRMTEDRRDFRERGRERETRVDCNTSFSYALHDFPPCEDCIFLCVLLQCYIVTLY